MSLFFPTTPPAPIKPPATTTVTLDKALTDAFIIALQGQLPAGLQLAAAENFDGVQLPAVFVRAVRKAESIINSAIFQFTVEVTLAVQSDDSTPQVLEDLWGNVLDVAYDVTGIVAALNSVDPKLCHVYGVLREGGVSHQTSDRHFLRTVSLTVHAALLS
jgi:hypothetical protein